MATGTKAGKRVAIYTRVSKEQQTTENQLRELRDVAEHRGWEIVEVYTDHGISGAKGRDKRPALDALLKDATRRRFDIVAAWSIDRLGRSVHKVSAVMAELEQLGVGQFYLQQAIDTTTPAGKAMVGMCLVFAEFERDILIERINAGLARAREQGKTLGRPKLSATVEAAVLAARAEGKGIRKTAKELGIGVSAVQRIERGRAV